MSTTENDFQWLVDHSLELHKQYAGKWIAVHEGKVIGTGDTCVEAAEQARKTAADGEYILEALDPIGDYIYGCA